ncbi:MAG: TIGR04086 family membrane protein [Clostridiales bacterium]|nr:TIGR04086 family membrane protein [Clostridiales bacterium]
MAQQMVRRVRRKTGARRNTWWKGVLVAVAVTLGAVAAFAVLIGLTEMQDGLIRVVNQLIKVGAIFAGVWYAVPRGDSGGIRRGALIGLVYMGIGVLVYALLTQQKLTVMGYAIDLLMGVAAGGLSGMILGAMQEK